jgi:hypothetical protein
VVLYVLRCAVLRSAKLFSAEKVDLPALIKEEHAAALFQ